VTVARAASRDIDRVDTSIPAIDPLPRLDRLRAALLEAPYRLCTQKAELLTEYLRASSPPRRALPTAVERTHYRMYARGLSAQINGERTSPVATRAHGAALALYDRFEGTTLAERLLSLARGFRHVLETMPLRVYDDELLVGNPSAHRVGAPIHPDYGGLLMHGELRDLAHRPVNPIAVAPSQIELLEQEVFPFWFRRSVLGQATRYIGPGAIEELSEGRAYLLTQAAGISHVTPDYQAVVERGLSGIEADLRARLARLHRDVPRGDRELSRAFLLAAQISVRAAMAHGRRWRDYLRAEAARHPDTARSRELCELAALFETVPARPARTLHEALQAIVVTHAAVHQESFQHGVSFGRMDQYLYPYYRRDIAAGRLTPTHATELLGCFLGKGAELLPLFFARATPYFAGLSSASGITLGGRRPDGSDAANELSHLFLVAYDRMRLRQPNVHVRVHTDSDPEFLRHCYRVLRKGGGIPALFNDDRVVPALRDVGVSDADAVDYAVVGCAEWGPQRCAFPAAGAVFINLANALELALRDVEDPADIHAVFAAFARRLRAAVARATAGNDAIERAHADYRPTPFLSAIVGGCVDSARDVTRGGATYNRAGVQGVGLADVADSLAALEQVLFRERRVTFAELMRALDADFVGHAQLRAFTESRVGGYGEAGDRAEHWAAEVSRLFVRTVGAHSLPRGGRYAAGFWTMTTHQGFGAVTGALPSGRRAGAPLANGISPRTGHERRGPTAALAAAARVAAAPNGCVLNHKLQPCLLVGEAGERVLDGLVRGYFALGGQQVQIEVVDPAILRDARQHPERYRDLVVRISGYSAYFNDLTDEMKEELIARTAHGATA